MRVGGIVLCGGRSSRMGSPKAWLPFGGEPMLARVVRVVCEAVQLTNSNDEQIRLFLQNPVLSAKVKAGLRRALRLRGRLARTQQEVGEQQRQLGVLVEDQGRLRANLKEVPQGSAPYKTYLKKLEAQEPQIEKYQAEVKRLQAAEHQQKKDLDDFLATFSAD